MRYLLSESGAAAVRSIASRRGGAGLDPRDLAQPGVLAETFGVEIRELSGSRHIRIYIPNRAGLVKLDGETASAATGVLNGWNDLGPFGGVQTIVYLELTDSASGRRWSPVPRTSNAPAPTGSGLVLPSLILARIDADGTVHQLHTGAVAFTSHYIVRVTSGQGSADKAKLLNRIGEVVAEIDGTGAITFAHDVTVTGTIDASGGISNSTGITIGGSLYAPTRLGTGEVVLARQ